MLSKLKKIMGCIEQWVKKRDTNRIVSWCIVSCFSHWGSKENKESTGTQTGVCLLSSRS